MFYVRMPRIVKGNNMGWQDLIAVDPKVLISKPIVKGTTLLYCSRNQQKVGPPLRRDTLTCRTTDSPLRSAREDIIHGTHVPRVDN